MQIIQGDLISLAIEGKFDCIVHCCNCFHCMNAGIAYQIKNTFPEALIEDKKTAFGSKNKLGSYSVAKSGNVIIVNAYGQYDTGLYQRQLDYDALRCCMYNINRDPRFQNLQIGLPMIGCGLAGGDWKTVETILDEELVDRYVTVVEYWR